MSVNISRVIDMSRVAPEILLNAHLTLHNQGFTGPWL